MTVLIIVLVVSLVLLAWSALTTCSFATFQPSASLLSQVVGPGAYTQVAAALGVLPGVRLLERNGNQMLLSVLPTPTSLGRGFGMFLVARQTDDGVLLLAKQRLPIAMTKLDSALREVEREARMSIQLRLHDLSDGGLAE